MTVTVYHFEHDAPGVDREDIRDLVAMCGRGPRQVEIIKRVHAAGGYLKVAEVESDDLEHAYKLTQNGVVSDSWSMEPPKGLTFTATLHVLDGQTYGRRSSMIGDIFDVNGEKFYCDTFGFTKLEGV